MRLEDSERQTDRTGRKERVRMTIGAVSFQPYVYNVNAVSPASMNRLSGISDNVLDKKTDYSGLTEAENENPLERGQTLHFQDMLDMQMQRGRSVAARVMKPMEETNGALETELAPSAAGKFDRENMTDAVQAQPEGDAVLESAQNIQTAAFGGDGVSDFRMQQAISAYEMFMTA